MRGRFITFEGIDGAGKSSHIEPLAAWLRERGQQVVVTREPGGTALAERLRELVLKERMDGVTEALMVFAARRDHLNVTILPALFEGMTVLCDRFTDATFAYQGWGRGIDLPLLETLEDIVHHGLQPDLTLWFDLPAAVAAARRSSARHADRIESESPAFFERVRAGYASRAAAFPQRFVRIDAERSQPEVWKQVQHAVEEGR